MGTSSARNDSVKPVLENDSWVVVQAGTAVCAVPTLSVQTMVMLPKVVGVPKVPSHVRGVIHLRGQVLSLVDLRILCGVETLAKHIDDLCRLLEQREQDHRNWLAELEKSVAEHRKFTLATDPHKCAFGKWYDHFHTDDLILGGLLRKFDQPHKAIHAIGLRVEQHKETGDFDAATAAINTTRDTDLARLLELFAATRQHMRSSTREIAVVIESEGKRAALCVDKVESAEHLDAVSVRDIPDIRTVQRRQLVSGIATRKKGEKMVVLLNVEALLDDAEEIVAQVA
jgi:purine-binding chemotaxis protein CheW